MAACGLDIHDVQLIIQNDMQKMSNSLETIQQILRAITTPHPSSAPSSASEHLGSSKRNPTYYSSSFDFSACTMKLARYLVDHSSWLDAPTNQYTACSSYGTVFSSTGGKSSEG